ncbi:aspartate aminotransferase family protein [Embleya sp. NBC_00896]|uniref:aspartate aminotransferase family protein n=1 Tax=Embleya sp. NBC_00896 TaxID=2975961 RepID=UPI00386677BA|nr:aspartate aminotransferase family protein [Embleya sp. NBC_00896]
MTFDLGETYEEYADRSFELHAKHLNPQLPRVLRTIGMDRDYVRAAGPYLYDDKGDRYLDFLSGFGTYGVGRHHPVVRKAMQDVIALDLPDIVHFHTPPLAAALADRLLARAPGLDRVYFCNSGTEAVEAALKFARFATGRRRIVYIDHAFHGLTTGALSVNGAAEFRKGFEPLLPDVGIKLGDLDALARELKRGDVAALIIEPILGKGVHVPPPGWLAAAQKLLREHGALLIADEVQTGMGRTGKFFAYQWEDGVEPDIVTVAKALSGGYVPIGATLARDWVFKKVYSTMDRVLVHDCTFGGNNQAMAAGLATLAVLDDEDLIGNCARMGDAFVAGLTPLIDKYELFAQVRGRGLMIGLEFGKPRSLKLRAGWTALQAARHGLFAQMVVVPMFQRHRVLTQVAGDHMDVIKLLPPYVIGQDDVDHFVAGFVDVMDDAHKGTGLMWDFGRTLIKQAMTNR